jgi:hypothetical protein
MNGVKPGSSASIFEGQHDPRRQRGPVQDQRNLCTKWDAQTRIRASEGAYLDRDLR